MLSCVVLCFSQRSISTCCSCSIKYEIWESLMIKQICWYVRIIFTLKKYAGYHRHLVYINLKIITRRNKFQFVKFRRLYRDNLGVNILNTFQDFKPNDSLIFLFIRNLWINALIKVNLITKLSRLHFLFDPPWCVW